MLLSSRFVSFRFVSQERPPGSYAAASYVPAAARMICFTFNIYGGRGIATCRLMRRDAYMGLIS